MRKIKILSFLSLMLLALLLLVSCIEEMDKTSDKDSEKITYFEVSFETNQGSEIRTKSIQEGKKLYEPSEPTKVGYEFSGWYYDDNYKSKVEFPIEITTDITLYAKWIEYHYVSFSTNGGNYIKPSRVLHGSEFYDTARPEKEGYLFNGWYLDEETTVVALFPLTITKETTLYAKWLKLYDVSKCENAKLKDWGDNNDSASYYITPDGFDLDALAEKGYRMKITITFDVYYKKDYDVPFDIGYAGAPKYDVWIVNSEGRGYSDEDNTAPSSTKTRTFEAIYQMSDLKNEKIRLVFETDNIQNLIYFQNINITYECIK